MPRYAASTEVSSDKSRQEIEKTLARYGASEFLYHTGPGRAIIGFRMNGRGLRFHLPMPDRDADEFRYTPVRGYERDARSAAQAYEQAVRQRWRALALVVKAKLEAVEAGIAEFDQEFLAYLQLPNGATVGDWLVPQVDEIYRSGQMPALLPGLPALSAPRPGPRR